MVSEIVPRTLDLLARLLDLTNTISDSVPGTTVVNTLQWLGREQLSQHDLTECLKKAGDLAYPNKEGESILQTILSPDNRRPPRHLTLKNSGSLGQILAVDRQL